MRGVREMGDEGSEGDCRLETRGVMETGDEGSDGDWRRGE